MTLKYFLPSGLESKCVSTTDFLGEIVATTNVRNVRKRTQAGDWEKGRKWRGRGENER
jgi:hypothetical protein